MTIARYPFTCCQWSSMSTTERSALIELVNAAGDRMSQQPSSADEQQRAIERIRERALARSSRTRRPAK